MLIKNTTHYLLLFGDQTIFEFNETFFFENPASIEKKLFHLQEYQKLVNHRNFLLQNALMLLTNKKNHLKKNLHGECVEF